MRLALAEIRRAKARFGLLSAAVALLVFLILFQQSIAGSLLGSFTGGLERQSASVLIFNADARRSVDGSRVAPAQVAAVEAVPGVAQAGPIGEASFSVDVGGTITDTTVFGYELGGPGAPTTLSDGRLPGAEGEAVASIADAEAGYGLGATLLVVPGDVPIRVVGVAEDINFNVQPTLFVSYPTYERLVRATNPDARGVVPSLVGVEPRSGITPADLAARIDRSVEGVEALDRATAVASLPGASSIRQSFAIILGLAFVVVVLLTGFFFLIITVQKASALTLLRAVGAGNGFLLRALVTQVILVIVSGAALAVGLVAVAAAGASSGSLEVRLEPAIAAVTVGAILGLGLLSTGAAMRRVVRLDPAAATQRSGGGGLA